jgi:eukaryotic-like serine/threonine-protein kinase
MSTPNGSREPKAIGPASTPDEIGAFEFDSDDAWRRRARAADAAEPLGEIAGYTLLEACARGGQGVVYRCLSPSGRVVALKRLHGGAAATAAARARLVRELDLLSKLDHPSIVRARPVAAGDEILLEMDWIEGRALVDWARPDGRRRATSEILDAFASVCDALQHAHERGVVHRDLKPSNVLVDRDGRPHVLDFGLAASLADPAPGSPRLTRTTQFVGTPAYAAPELLAGDAASVDERVDVYGVGVLLYEAFTGTGPYPENASLAQLLRAIESLEPTRPRRKDPTVPADVEAVIVAALRKDPRGRYASAKDLAADLERCASGARPSAAPVGLAFDLRCLAQRSPRLVAAAAVAFVALVAVATVATVDAARLRGSRNETLAAHEAAERANDVLVNLLLEMDGRSSRPGDALAELLDGMAKVLPQETGGDPGALARTRVAFGRLYARIGRYAEAEAHLSAAIDTYRTMGRADRTSVADALSLLGLARAHRKLPGAVERQREALDVVERSFAAGAATKANYYAAMGETLLLANGLSSRDEANAWFDRALAQLGAVGERFPSWKAEILTSKARALGAAGDAAAALAAAREALALIDTGDPANVRSAEVRSLVELEALLLDETGDAEGAARERARLAPSPSKEK